MRVYPIFLNNLEGRRCIVFGGGHEAERKALELEACGAEVIVISDSVTNRLARAAEEEQITWIPRSYRPGDLHGAFLAIASETNPEATAPIHAEAETERVLLNAMDDVQHCSFVAGSVVRRGPLVLAISTSGAAPAFSVRLRERFEAEFGPEHEQFLHLMMALREPMAAKYPDFSERRALWYHLIDADLPAFIRESGVESARDRIAAITGITLEETVGT